MARSVVITRPQAQADALARALALAGHQPVMLPLLEIHALADQAPLARAMAALDQYRLVAFVSPNAIDAAFAHLSGWPHGVMLAVLGEGSRAALARHGVCEANATIVAPIEATRSDSEGLLAALDLAALAGRRVLIVRGESGRELIGEGLRAAGAEVSTVAAYRRCVPSLTPALAARLTALLEKQNDWVITSSEALRGLMALLGQMGSPDLVVKMKQQHLIVPHARIAETARALGLSHLALTGSGDAGVLAALQSRV
ncbi:MAG: uroporphyrinogen-III synthase [Pseudomonadota bacterium]